MLVTIFGDLARNPEDRIEGPTLTRLTEGMGLKPEAVRVALHRLRNDDWIASVKSGRTASHGLTPHGRRESLSASRIIYARQEELPVGWQLALLESSDADQKPSLQAEGFVQLLPRVFVGNGQARVPQGVAVFMGDTPPNWLSAQIVPADVTAEYETLLTALRQTSARVADLQPGQLRPLDVALTRCLIVHHWRRLVLRHPYLPPALTGAAWPGHLCRAEVTHLLARFQRPALHEIQGT
ncbi:PaaX family transcriptional regulator C-terminal domain-containing protein [Aliishimia ponticola]|nr:PaaX family transcriptional regulator C-terminal domain-containing protein [Aliishimia ponticola]